MRRSFFGELEWSLDQIRAANSDQNPNRQSQIRQALDYSLAVAIAKRSRESIPPRPDIVDGRTHGKGGGE